MKMILIRRYKSGDKEQIKNLVHSVLKEIFHSTPRNLEDLEDIKNNFEIFLVAQDKEGNIIGAAGIKQEKNVARVSRMYVKKEFRREEIGRLLMNNLLEYCKKRGFRKIFLTTYKQMSSEEFYKKIGFVKVKTKGNVVFMEKEI